MIYLYLGIAILVLGAAAYLIYRQRSVPPPQSSESETSEPAPDSEVAEAVPEKVAVRITPARPATPATRGAARIAPAPPAAPAARGSSKIAPERPAVPVTEKVTYPIAEYSTLSDDAKIQLMNAVWYRCENPHCNHTEFLDVHHIVDDGSNDLDNLIVLCPTCHAAAHNNEITEEALRSWPLEREKRFKTELDWPYK